MAYATKTNILTFASKAWGTTFSGSSLDAAIIACLGDLNGSDLLQGHVGFDGKKSLGAGDDKFYLPADYKSVFAFQVTERHVGAGPNAERHVLLKEAVGGIPSYRKWQLLNAAPGLPLWYIEEHDHLRVFPIPDRDYGVRFDYWANHPLAPDAIVYDVKFQHLLNLGTVYWEAVLRRNQEYINHWGPLYYAERQAMENKAVPIMRSVNP